MKRIFVSIVLITLILFTGLSLSSCDTLAVAQESSKDIVITTTTTQETAEDIAIEKVKANLTTAVTGKYKAVKYENGYVVNFDDMAYWYVEGDTVYSLNGFAKTYAANTEYKYGIDWNSLF